MTEDLVKVAAVTMKKKSKEKTELVNNWLVDIWHLIP